MCYVGTNAKSEVSDRETSGRSNLPFTERLVVESIEITETTNPNEYDNHISSSCASNSFSKDTVTSAPCLKNLCISLSNRVDQKKSPSVSAKNVITKQIAPGEPNLIVTNADVKPNSLNEDTSMKLDQEVAPDKVIQRSISKCNLKTKTSKCIRTKSEPDIKVDKENVNIKPNLQNKQSIIKNRVQSSTSLHSGAIGELFDSYNNLCGKTEELEAQNNIISDNSRESSKGSSRTPKDNYSDINIVDLTKSEDQRSLATNADVRSLYYNRYDSSSDSSIEHCNSMTDRSQIKSVSTAITYCSNSQEKLSKYPDGQEKSAQNNGAFKKIPKQVINNRAQSNHVRTAAIKKPMQESTAYKGGDLKLNMICSEEIDNRQIQPRGNNHFYDQKQADNKKQFVKRTIYNVSPRDSNDSYYDMSDDEYPFQPLNQNCVEEMNTTVCHLVPGKDIEKFYVNALKANPRQNMIKTEAQRTKSDVRTSFSPNSSPRSCMSSAASAHPKKPVMRRPTKPQCKRNSLKSIPPNYRSRPDPGSTSYQNYPQSRGSDNLSDEYNNYSYYQDKKGYN